MVQFVVANEGMVRLAAFALLLALFLVYQGWRPFRPGILSRRRGIANFGLAAVDTVVLRVLFPAAGVGAAFLATEHKAGLFNALDLPAWFAVGASVVAHDLAVYIQHWLTHRVPILWRLHRVHHSDIALDVTTALRFHPAEIVLSLLIKIVVILALGAPAVAVVLFEILLNGAAMFNHTNVRLPAGLERPLRRVIVTPDMHRVHHSVHRDETDSNYGFCLSVWDRLFGTYRDQPRDGHRDMVIGLEDFRNDQSQRLDRLLLQPLANPPRGSTKDLR
ncbi:MAG: sterol desaturase family protein [Rhodospirillales bacterium]